MTDHSLPLRAITEVAEQHALRFDRAIVLSDRTNLIVELSPARIVARVATHAMSIRPNDAWFRREVAVASALARAGAPVVPPATEIPPGPHTAHGFVITFWRLVDCVDEPIDPRAAGRALRTCHEALSDFSEPLPLWAPIDEAERVANLLIERGYVSTELGAVILRTIARQRARIAALSWQTRPLHGDAHLGNVLNTRAGPLWSDWEDTFAGPVSWDLACLISRTRLFGTDDDSALGAFEAYGSDVAETELDLLVEVRAVYVLTWAVLITRFQGDSLSDLEPRIRWLCERDAGTGRACRRETR